MNNPVWIDEKGKIIEPEYCRDFLSRHPMRCINDRFYTVDGPLTDESKLKRTIYEEISPWLHAKVAQTVEQIIKALKLAAYTDPLPLQCDRIHVANGTCFLDGTFTEEKEYCGNRLSVSYRADAPAPEHWLCFLSELLEPEDIPALQEYLGYCLIPSTKGQKMLMLIGKGGEGKSRIGVVMNAIFGLNMNTTSIQKVENNRFARADLEGKLLMVDDDLDMNALTKTNYVKSIVTAELRMDLERKREQSYQELLYVRFLCFGNGALTALHDRSDGFFRRQIILTTKDKPADRFDDPFLAEKLIAEKEGYVAFKADYEASTKNLYAAYKRWCEDNAENPLSPKSFANQLSQNAERYHLEPVNNLHIGGGKRCRGYMGIYVLLSPMEL